MRPRGETDITSVFGTDIRGSNPLEGIGKNMEKIKKLFFIFFILFSIAFVFWLYKLEMIGLAGFMIAAFGLVFVCLCYLSPLISIPVIKMIFRVLFIFAPVIIILGSILIPILTYICLRAIGQMENEFGKKVIEKIAPQFLNYQFYILFGSYLIFEILIRLLSRYSKELRTKVEENPLMIRFYFVAVVWGTATLLISFI